MKVEDEHTFVKPSTSGEGRLWQKGVRYAVFDIGDLYGSRLLGDANAVSDDASDAFGRVGPDAEKRYAGGEAVEGRRAASIVDGCDGKL